MSFLPEFLRADLDRAINGDGEMSDALADAIGADPELCAAWDTFMRTDRIGQVITDALASKPPCPNRGKSMPEGCPYCGVKHMVLTLMTENGERAIPHELISEVIKISIPNASGIMEEKSCYVKLKDGIRVVVLHKAQDVMNMLKQINTGG